VPGIVPEGATVVNNEGLRAELKALQRDAADLAAGLPRDAELPDLDLAKALLEVHKARERLGKLAVGLNGHAGGKE
jgi:Tfp pilus assembly protein PilO